jgi:hypothetical protein
MEVVVNAEPVKGSKEKRPEFDKWEIEDAYRTLKRAEEIKANPKLMRLIKAEHDKDMKATQSLSGLKELANKKMAEEAESEDEE